LRRWTEGATYIRQGDHHVGHWPTFLVLHFSSPNLSRRRLDVYHTSTHNVACCKIHFAFKSYVLLHWQRYCTALEQRPSAKLCGVVQRTRNGITKLSQRAPHVFGWTAITLGIGLHSGLNYDAILYVLYFQRAAYSTFQTCILNLH